MKIAWFPLTVTLFYTCGNSIESATEPEVIFEHRFNRDTQTDVVGQKTDIEECAWMNSGNSSYFMADRSLIKGMSRNMASRIPRSGQYLQITMKGN
jgi:hypothetical protein